MKSLKVAFLYISLVIPSFFKASRCLVAVIVVVFASSAISLMVFGELLRDLYTASRIFGLGIGPGLCLFSLLVIFFTKNSSFLNKIFYISVFSHLYHPLFDFITRAIIFGTSGCHANQSNW
jgi:hypothetical protein